MTFCIDLTAMTKASVKFTQFAVRMTNPDISTYQYRNKKTGETVRSYKLECRLVGSKETEYITGVFKGSEKAVAEGTKNFKDGSIFILSSIKFEENRELGFISSPVKLSVDLNKSKVLNKTDDQDLDRQLAKVSVPPRTVAETTKITISRHQDLLAIVTKVCAVRHTKTGDALDVTVMDASEDTPGVFAKVEISVMNTSKHKKLAVGQTLVFFNLACKVNGDSKQFTHWDSSFLCEAPSCEKHTQLLKDFEQLKNAANTKTLTNYTPKNSIDVSGPQTIGASALLDYTAQNPKAKIPEILQIMLATIEEPAGSVTAEGSDRIWFITKLRDFSGVTEVGVPEKVALELAKLDKKGFMDAHANNNLQFPLICNIRLSRKASTGASYVGRCQPDERTFVNHIVEHAKEVDWQQNLQPNAIYNEVLEILNELPRNEEGLVFAFLSDIEPDPHTGFRCHFKDTGHIVKGAAVAVLIANHNKPKPPEALGEGYKVLVTDLEDVANPDAVNSLQTTSVTGFCTVHEMSKFDLTPPRGHTKRFAIAIITSCETISAVKILHMDKMQPLEPGDGPKAIPVFKGLRTLTMKVNPANTDERKHSLDIAEDKIRPLKICRTISAMPSDENLMEP